MLWLIYISKPLFMDASKAIYLEKYGVDLAGFLIITLISISNNYI